MTAMLASSLVLLTGLYFVGLAMVSLLSPARAAHFLQSMAGSAYAHYLELLLRLVVGSAILVQAPRMLFPGVFVAFGWILVVTTAGLFAIPWQWHHRFAQRSVPYAVRNLKLVAFAAFVFGGFILTAAIRGTA
jgi:hypothetical protein